MDKPEKNHARRWWRFLAMMGGLLALVMIALVAVVVGSFAGTAPITDGKELAGGARVVKDGIVSAFVLTAGEGAVVLIDCGNDPESKAIVAELTRRGLDANAVSAIFLTHGHRDHVHGCARFVRAQVFALEPDVALAEGRAGSTGPIGRWMPVRPTGLTIMHSLKDGDVVHVGPLQVSVFAVPGHTPGSAAYLADGVLYLGDSADSKKDGAMRGAKWIFSDSVEQNHASLVALERRLAPRAAEVNALAFAHSGALESFAPLRAFAERR